MPVINERELTAISNIIAKATRSTVVKTATTIAALSIGGLTVGAVSSASASPNPTPVGCSTAIVTEGDTLYSVGLDAGLSVERMIQINPQIPNPDLLHVGDLVCITAPPSMGVDIGTALHLDADWVTVEIPANGGGDFQPNGSTRSAVWEAFGDLGLGVFTEALAIARCESSFNPSAHRTDSDPEYYTGDLGLMQINVPVWEDVLVGEAIIRTRRDLFNEGINARAARFIYDRTGDFSAWYMSGHCHELD